LRKARQRGNALIEFALSATLLFTLFVDVVSFSRLFNIANMAAGAAMAGIPSKIAVTVEASKPFGTTIEINGDTAEIKLKAGK
jgi:hypothetical protein